MRSDKKNQLFLRRYIRESLTTESALDSLVKGANNLFLNFLKRRWSSFDKYLGEKLNELLPDELKKKIVDKQNNNIFDVVHKHLNKSNKHFSENDKKRVYDQAVKTYVDSLKKGIDNDSSIEAVQRFLDSNDQR